MDCSTGANVNNLPDSVRKKFWKVAVNCRPYDPVNIREAQMVSPIMPKTEPMSAPGTFGRPSPSTFQASSAPGLSLPKFSSRHWAAQGLAGILNFLTDWQIDGRKEIYFRFQNVWGVFSIHNSGGQVNFNFSGVNWLLNVFVRGGINISRSGFRTTPEVDTPQNRLKSKEIWPRITLISRIIKNIL